VTEANNQSSNYRYLGMGKIPFF